MDNKFLYVCAGYNFCQMLLTRRINSPYRTYTPWQINSPYLKNSDDKKYLYQLLRYESVRVPLESIEETIRIFIQDDKIKTSYLILSSEKIILRFVSIPLLKSKDLDMAIKLLYKEYFPIKQENYFFEYRILYKNRKEFKILLTAIPIKYKKVYFDIFNGLNLRINKLEVFENISGKNMTNIEPALFVKRQESTYRIFWMADDILQDAWHISYDSIYGAKEFKIALTERNVPRRIRHCFLYGICDDWIFNCCKTFGLMAHKISSLNSVLHQYCLF